MTAMILPAWHHLGHRAYFFGQFGTACLVTVSAALLVPVTVRLVQEFLADRGSIAWRLLLMAVPPAFLGFVVVALSTSSGWFRGVAFIGLAPLAVVLLGEWGRILRRDGGRLTFGLTAIGLIVALLVALGAENFLQGRPVMVPDASHLARPARRHCDG